MENKNYDKKIYGSAVYDSFRVHKNEYQELLLKQKNQKDKFTEQDAKDLEYHKKRMAYIKKFVQTKQVPLIYVPDCHFQHECKPSADYSVSVYKKKEGKKDTQYNPSLNELLYPAWCYDEETNKMLVENSQCCQPAVQDKASPYKPDNSFLIKQKENVNTCYFMSLMIGIVSHGGEYIKNKMIRDYSENGADDNNGNYEEYDKDVDDNIDDDMDDDDLDNLNVKGRSDKAVVRLFDEDGLPVDVVVDKTRPDKDTRAMWIIVLEKAACVMMSQNKFKNCYKDELSKAEIEKSFTAKSIAKGIDWYDLGKSESHEIDEKEINVKFNMDDIDHALEAQGIKLILGKNCEEQWIKNTLTNKEKYINDIKKYVDSGKLVIVATGKKTAGELKNTDHIFYVSSIDMDKGKITTLDSISGKITTSFDEFLEHIVQIHVTDFPDTEKTIEQEINSNKIQEIENEVVNKTIDDIDNINKKIDVRNKSENENQNNKDVQIGNNENKNKEEETKTAINNQNIKEDSMPAVDNENDLKYQTEISKQQDHGPIENKTNENGGYLSLISKNQFDKIKTGSIKSINDLLNKNISQGAIQALISNYPNTFSDSAFADFDLNNNVNKKKLGLTSTTPQTGRKRRIFLAVLLYVCFGLGYFTGWSKKLLDAADSIDRHNKYLVKVINLIKAKNKNALSLPNEKQVINQEKSKIGQEQNKTPETTNNQRPLQMVQKNTQTVAISATNNIKYEDKNQEQNDLY